MPHKSKAKSKPTRRAKPETKTKATKPRRKQAAKDAGTLPDLWLSVGESERCASTGGASIEDLGRLTFGHIASIFGEYHDGPWRIPLDAPAWINIEDPLRREIIVEFLKSNLAAGDHPILERDGEYLQERIMAMEALFVSDNPCPLVEGLPRWMKRACEAAERGKEWADAAWCEALKQQRRAAWLTDEPNNWAERPTMVPEHRLNDMAETLVCIENARENEAELKAYEATCEEQIKARKAETKAQKWLDTWSPFNTFYDWAYDKPGHWAENISPDSMKRMKKFFNEGREAYEAAVKRARQKIARLRNPSGTQEALDRGVKIEAYVVQKLKEMGIERPQWSSENPPDFFSPDPHLSALEQCFEIKKNHEPASGLNTRSLWERKLAQHGIRLIAQREDFPKALWNRIGITPAMCHLDLARAWYSTPNNPNTDKSFLARIILSIVR